jgi:antirestriction protein
MAVIEACVTNLGKYNEGELCGEYLRFPATKGDVQDLLSYIGIDGVIYEDFIITDYGTDIKGLYRLLGEYESIDELNYLAAMLADLDKNDLEKFEAVLEYEDYTSNVEQLINLAQNLDCYDFYPDVMNSKDLGIYYTGQLETLSIPESLEHYIDYEAYGRDMAINEGGVFTKNGYIVNNGDIFVEQYKGRHIPDDFRIFAYPDPPEKMSIKQQLKMYGKMALNALTADRPEPVHDERS